MRSSTFADEKVLECSDLQRLLRTRIDAIADDVLIVAEEFGAFADARRRMDLLGVDREGHLVVLELKRTLGRSSGTSGAPLRGRGGSRLVVQLSRLAVRSAGRPSMARRRDRRSAVLAGRVGHSPIWSGHRVGPVAADSNALHRAVRGDLGPRPATDIDGDLEPLVLL